MAYPENFRLEEGMNVVDLSGNSLGTLDTVVIEDRTGKGRFLNVDHRLVPMEAIVNVEGKRVEVGISREDLAKLPTARRGESPSPEDVQRARGVVGIRE